MKNSMIKYQRVCLKARALPHDITDALTSLPRKHIGGVAQTSCCWRGGISSTGQLAGAGEWPGNVGVSPLKPGTWQP